MCLPSVPKADSQTSRQKQTPAKWHDNGQEAERCIFKDGKPEGLMTTWYENGQKKSEVSFKDGKLEGLARKWDKEGKKVDETRFKNGVPDKE